MDWLRWLRDPRTREIEDLDDPRNLALHSSVIRSKGLLSQVYREFYEAGTHALAGRGAILELASGAGFAKEVVPDLITSDIVAGPGIDIVCDASSVPLEDGSLGGIFVMNGFHHFSDPTAAIAEASRLLAPGGRFMAIEPANTSWGRFVYGRLHHEPFDTRADWQTTQTGRLSGGNGALPWIVFVRDRDRLAEVAPELGLVSVTTHTPFAYIASGGLAWRQLLPSAAYRPLRAIEAALPASWGMFMTVIMEKKPAR